MTAICLEINYYEEAVWRYLSNVFQYRLKASELGFTDDLIYRITDFYGGRPENCEVYSFNDNVFEATRGADIDLFIEENGTGYYHFYMLQAKMMNYEGKYKDIKRWTPNAQYYKLINRARIEGAFPLYLLYNGNTANSNIGNTHWGLSIVEATQVGGLRFGQRVLAQAPIITFNELHPLNMKPFHVLFCDSTIGYDLPETIDGTTIYNGFPYINVFLPAPDNQPEEKYPEEDWDKLALNIIKERNLGKFRLIINTEKEQKQ